MPNSGHEGKNSSYNIENKERKNYLLLNEFCSLHLPLVVSRLFVVTQPLIYRSAATVPRLICGEPSLSRDLVALACDRRAPKNLAALFQELCYQLTKSIQIDPNLISNSILGVKRKNW